MPTLRPMLPANVDASTEMILGNDWGVRRDWLAFAATQPACISLVAEADGVIVGTGVGTANGTVGWIGTIFLAPAWRGQGLGRALTQEIIDRLETAGCRTLVLVATEDGRRLYSRMGFDVQTRYRILEAPGLAVATRGLDASDRVASSLGVRPFEAGDLDGMLELDRHATGEDRGHVIRRLATPGAAKVATDDAGGVAGFVIRAPWGGGATVARSADAALDLIHARRAAADTAGRVRVGLLEENAEGLARLTALGFVERWSAPRMARGAPLAWHPDRIWGQFNHAMG